MDLNPPAYRLGIDLGGTKIEARLLTPAGQECWRKRRATPAGDYAGTVAAVAALAQAARAALQHVAPGHALRIGVGTPGAAAADGRMKNCNSTCLNGQPLQADLETALGQPVAMANDANCLALSEARDGAAAGAAVVFAVILGTGCGGGIALNGQVHAGPNRLAGEWGHNPLPWAHERNDPPYACYCGRRGCIETYVSGSGLAHDHRHVTGQALAGEAIVERACAGDAACQATLQRHTERLGRALASVINLLDPDVIVLGGGLSTLPHLLSDLPQAWSPWVFAGGLREPVRTPLRASLHGDASGARGAAWLPA